MDKLNFIMGLHCHQPVDNFASIFEDAYRMSYEPFLATLERFPGVKASLHYSGSLLEWILNNRPEFIDRLRTLVKRSQVELLTGGYYEPILPMVPYRDAKEQIGMLNGFIEEKFGCSPAGIWLTERVWDPALKGLFRELDLSYSIVDDFHLKRAGVGEEKVFGHYGVKGIDGFSVFPSVKKLRYSMPFRETDETVNILKEIGEKYSPRSVTFADDCEKFGYWPHTYDWVFKKGWLERFFANLEEDGHIRTLTFSEALRETKSLGEIDIPHASYEEMFNWCEGNFMNFFRKYPESDRMRKRMLHLSDTLQQLESGDIKDSMREKVKEAKRELYKAQANCAYWHGIFGGVYTDYLRQGVYKHLIKADTLLNNPRTHRLDKIHLDEREEDVIVAANGSLTLFINPSYAGSLSEIDYTRSSRNLTNTMSRRPEPYHEKLHGAKKIDLKRLKRKIDFDNIDLYEVLGVRERNLERLLHYDPYRRFSLLCHVLERGTTLSDFVASKHADTDKKSFFGPYSYRLEKDNEKISVYLERNGEVMIENQTSSMNIAKCIILKDESEISVKLDVRNTSSGSVNCLFGVEFNWSMEDRAYLRKRKAAGLTRLDLTERSGGLAVSHVFGEKMDLWSFPVYTVNESERGLSKSFQGIALFFHKELDLKEGECFSLGTKIRIEG